MAISNQHRTNAAGLWTRRFLPLCLAAVAMWSGAASVAHGNWPQWRGPYGTGAAGADAAPPIVWDVETHVRWKAKLPAWSASTPAVFGDRVFVMSPSDATPEATGDAGASDDNGRSRRRRGRGNGQSGPGGQDILLMCFERSGGELLWQRKLDAGNRMQMKQNSSSPSPVTDGKHVWATTGNGVVAAVDYAGEVAWTFDIQEAWGQFGLGFGYASSPLLHDGVLFMQVLHGRRTDDPSYVFALDAASGDVLWRQERPTDAHAESPDAYTTPALLLHEGQTQIVVLGGDYVTGHDPKTGREVWRSGGLNPRNSGNYRIVPSPVVAGDVIVAPTRVTPMLGVKAGGVGDITASHILWTWNRQGAPDVPTPAVDGDRLYLVDDVGRLTVANVKTGETHWGPIDTGAGRVSASPTVAAGRIYIVNEQGETTVGNVGERWEKLGVNALDRSYTLASPVVVGDEIFIRTGEYLYCITE